MGDVAMLANHSSRLDSVEAICRRLESKMDMLIALIEKSLPAKVTKR